jgi:hypothetical protein
VLVAIVVNVQLLHLLHEFSRCKVVIFWRADRCSRFGAASPTCVRPSEQRCFRLFDPFLLSSKPASTNQTGSPEQIRRLPNHLRLLAGRCWWHCVSRVLRPATLLRLDRVDGAGIFGRRRFAEIQAMLPWICTTPDVFSGPPGKGQKPTPASSAFY